MTRDVSPILDRHTQERLGQVLRDRVETAEAQRLPAQIETLLAELRGVSEGRPDERAR